MIKRFINFIKVDYSNVHFAIKTLSNDKIPTWAIVIYYSILIPFGLLLYYPVKWICDYYMKKMMIDIDKD